MQLRSILRTLLVVLVPVSLVSTLWLYNYPLLHACEFPSPSPYNHAKGSTSSNTGFASPELAPFRLLALGDPQLEGDSSLPNLRLHQWTNVFRLVQEGRYHAAGVALSGASKGVPRLVMASLQYLQKNLDLLGNDYYLAHIYRSMTRFTKPSHVTVLGDLLGSQWVNNDEFKRRSRRFWDRVFAGAERVPDDVIRTSVGEFGCVTNVETMGEDPRWSKRLLNVVGNHDVGYAGDLDSLRVHRFEQEFGLVNGAVSFMLNQTSSNGAIPRLQIVMMNSMNVDGPAYDSNLQQTTYDFVNCVIGQSLPVELHHHATILLTHIPLHKDAGICVDSPFFDYYEEDYGQGVKEQNMISVEQSSGGILQGIFGMHGSAEAPARGMGRAGLILTGHDHEGCDTYHHVDRDSETWRASRWHTDDAQSKYLDHDSPGVREVTVRSMMGEFGGNAALVSAWWDHDADRWRIEVVNCPLGIQHLWWGVHIADLITLGLAVCTIVVYISGLGAEDSKLQASRTLTHKDSSQRRSKKAFNSATQVPTLNTNASSSLGDKHKRPKA